MPTLKKQEGHEPLISFARGADGSIKNIAEVPSGFECKCSCLACKKALVARKGRIRQWHFAHTNQQSAACEWAAETALHFAMKDLIEQERRIFVPELHVTVERMTSWGLPVGRSEAIEGQIVALGTVMLEYSVHPIRPDVVAVAGGRRLFLEVVVTHGVDPKKLRHIREIGASAIEFDLRKYDRSVDREGLRKLLLSPSSVKKWIFHRRAAEIEAKLLEEVTAEIAALEEAEALRRKENAVRAAESRRVAGNGPAATLADPKWFANHQAAVAELAAKMRLTGKAICFCLKQGGEIFVHSHPDGLVLLDITESAAWIFPTLPTFSAIRIPESATWCMPKKLERALLVYLNSLSSSTRSVERHPF